MNTIGAVLFVMFMTLLGKWLLFDDDDRPISDEASTLRIADAPPDPKPSPISKSA